MACTIASMWVYLHVVLLALRPLFSIHPMAKAFHCVIDWSHVAATHKEAFCLGVASVNACNEEQKLSQHACI